MAETIKLGTRVEDVYQGGKLRSQKAHTTFKKLKDLYDISRRLPQLADKFKYDSPSGQIRSPMLVTCYDWLRDGKYIPLWVNPNNISWSLPRRESTTKTATGTVRNVWWNRYRKTHYDEGTLNITFQTGNILPHTGSPDIFSNRTASVQQTPIYDKDGKPFMTIPEVKNTTQQTYDQQQSDAIIELIKNPPVPPGLLDFYDFLTLVDQPAIRRAHENFHILLYRSKVFPRLRIDGYFTADPITFTESAEGNANMLTWQANFVIYRTYPRLNQNVRLAQVFSDAMRFNGGLSEMFPATFDLEGFLSDWDAVVGEDLRDPESLYDTWTKTSTLKPTTDQLQAELAAIVDDELNKLDAFSQRVYGVTLPADARAELRQRDIANLSAAGVNPRTDTGEADARSLIQANYGIGMDSQRMGPQYAGEPAAMRGDSRYPSQAVFDRTRAISDALGSVPDPPTYDGTGGS